MENIYSKFTLYEIFRIIIPGVYVTTTILNILKCYNENFLFNDTLENVVFFTVSSIFIGAIIYSMDIPRWFRNLPESLPTNLMRKEYPNEYANKKSRVVEREYNEFYYLLNNDLKVKTEIQSGLYHLFINLSFVGLLLFIIYAFVCDCDSSFFIKWFNLSLFIGGIVATIVLYKNRLKYSWEKNFEEFKIYKADKTKWKEENNK